MSTNHWLYIFFGTGFVVFSRRESRSVDGCDSENMDTLTVLTSFTCAQSNQELCATPVRSRRLLAPVGASCAGCGTATWAEEQLLTHMLSPRALRAHHRSLASVWQVAARACFLELREPQCESPRVARSQRWSARDAASVSFCCFPDGES